MKKRLLPAYFDGVQLLGHLSSSSHSQMSSLLKIRTAVTGMTQLTTTGFLKIKEELATPLWLFIISHWSSSMVIDISKTFGAVLLGGLYASLRVTPLNTCIGGDADMRINCLQFLWVRLRAGYHLLQIVPWRPMANKDACMYILFHDLNFKVNKEQTGTCSMVRKLRLWTEYGNNWLFAVYVGSLIPLIPPSFGWRCGVISLTTLDFHRR